MKFVKEEKFKVIQFIREMVTIVDKQMENFPKKEIELKNRIRKNTYDILEIAHEANIIENIEKKKELVAKIIAKVKIIDFLLNLSWEKSLITQKKYLKISMKLDDIAKYSNGWINSLRS